MGWRSALRGAPAGRSGARGRLAAGRAGALEGRRSRAPQGPTGAGAGASGTAGAARAGGTAGGVEAGGGAGAAGVSGGASDSPGGSGGRSPASGGGGSSSSPRSPSPSAMVPPSLSIVPPWTSCRSSGESIGGGGGGAAAADAAAHGVAAEPSITAASRRAARRGSRTVVRGVTARSSCARQIGHCARRRWGPEPWCRRQYALGGTNRVAGRVGAGEQLDQARAHPRRRAARASRITGRGRRGP
jgi:hypothetical protein